MKNVIKYDLYYLMKHALNEAEKACSEGEVPVGAVLANQDCKIIARAHNQPIALNDPSAHAEIMVMRKAGLALQNYRLTNTILAVTIEPCLMCMGAAINARVAQIIFGAADPKAGAACSIFNIASDERLNHSIDVVPGILEEECRTLIQTFFRDRRKNSKKIV